MSFHDTLTLDSLHSLPARIYVDIAARDADTDFNASAVNINKLVKIDSPVAAYFLVSVGPAVWLEFSSTANDTLSEILLNGNTTDGTDLIVSTGDVITLTDAPISGTDGANKDYVDSQLILFDTWVELTDTPGSITADSVVQGNTAGTALEFGQALKTTSTPTFDNLILTTGEITGTELSLTASTDDIVITSTLGDIFLESTAMNIELSPALSIILNKNVIINTTTGALRLPRLTTTERDALTPLSGMNIYNSTLNDVEFYNGVFWQSMGNGDVVGPAGATDNAIARFNTTTGKVIQNSLASITDAGGLTSTDVNIIAAESYKAGGFTVLFSDPTAFNVLVGLSTGDSINTGVRSTAVGHQALINEVDDNDQTAMGYRALFNILNGGGSNTGIGSQAGQFISGGATPNILSSTSVYLGAQTEALASGDANEIVIGFNATGIGSNSVVLGNDSIVTTALKGAVGIGIASPSAPLEVKTLDVTTEAVIFKATSQSGRSLSILQPDIADADAPFVFATNNAMTFRVDAVDALTIDDAGILGVFTSKGIVITNPLQADGDTLLNLNTARRWEFQQEGTGANASLRLRNTLGINKIFHIDTDGSSDWRSQDGSTTGMSIAHASGLLSVNSISVDVVNDNTVYFTSESDLPAPVSGVITLQENTTYILYNSDPTASQKQVTLANRLLIPDAGGVRITSVGLATALLIYTGTGNFITTTDTFTGFLHIDEIFIAAPSGTIFDIDGVLPIGSEFFPRIFLSNMGFFDTDTIGTIKTISVNMDVGAFFDCGQGLILDSVEEGLIDNWRFTNWKNEVNAIMMTWENTLRFPKINGCTFETDANEAAFDIQPNIGDETFIIAGNSYRGTGTIYKTGATGTVVAVTDQTANGTVTAVAGTAFGECIMTDVAHNLVEGQFITTSGFTDTNYNATDVEVLEIIDADNFRVHLPFAATDSGSWTSPRIQFTATNTLSVGEGVQITGVIPTEYNKGYRILGVSPTAFFMNGVDVGAMTQSGNFSTDSLTEEEPKMRVVGNAGMPDSKTVGFGQMNNNTNITTVTQNEYFPINAAGIVENAVTQRFILTNSTTGEFTYIGQEDLPGQLNAVISATKTGSTANYKFSTSINGVKPDSGSAPFAPMEVKTTKVSIAVLQPFNIVTGDTIQIMIDGFETSDDITITDYSIEVSSD